MVAVASQAKLQVTNLNRDRVLVTAGQVADNAWTRFRGLIGSKPLTRGEGLMIVPCSSIHTHFMGFAIDVLYVDREDVVVGFDQNLRPWRFGHLHRRVHFVIELPAGMVEATDTQVGDQLMIGLDGH